MNFKHKDPATGESIVIKEKTSLDPELEIKIQDDIENDDMIIERTGEVNEKPNYN